MACCQTLHRCCKHATVSLALQTGHDFFKLVYKPVSSTMPAGYVQGLPVLRSVWQTSLSYTVPERRLLQLITSLCYDLAREVYVWTSSLLSAGFALCSRSAKAVLVSRS